MPSIIRGSELNPEQRQKALAGYPQRCTFENQNEKSFGLCIACSLHIEFGGQPQINDRGTLKPYHSFHLPIVSDDEWLAGRTFCFTDTGELVS